MSRRLILRCPTMGSRSSSAEYVYILLELVKLMTTSTRSLAVCLLRENFSILQSTAGTVAGPFDLVRRFGRPGALPCCD